MDFIRSHQITIDQITDLNAAQSFVKEHIQASYRRPHVNVGYISAPVPIQISPY